MKILYISLTGLSEPLGRSQVLEYLINLSDENKIHILSFEREDDAASIEEIKSIVESNNIEWKYYFYSNKYGVISTVWQILRAVFFGSRLIIKCKIKLIHARSMIPAAIGLILKYLHGVKLLFDIRGFSIDEKLDSGRLSQTSFLFNALKKIDNHLYCSSDHIVTLTHKAKKILIGKNVHPDAITVIPTCASKTFFKVIGNVEKNKFKRALGYSVNDRVIIHTGTVSGWYDFDSEVKLIKEIMKRNQDVHFLIVNKKEHLFIKQVIGKYKLNQKKVKIVSASFDEMYKYLNIADCSLFFITPSYSKLASMPTKFAENIACHLPSVTNTEIGDVDFYMKNYNVGYLVDLKKLDDNLFSIAKQISIMIENNGDNKSEYDRLFRKYFDKSIAVYNYKNIYNSIHDGF